MGNYNFQNKSKFCQKIEPKPILFQDMSLTFDSQTKSIKSMTNPIDRILQTIHKLEWSFHSRVEAQLAETQKHNKKVSSLKKKSFLSQDAVDDLESIFERSDQKTFHFELELDPGLGAIFMECVPEVVKLDEETLLTSILGFNSLDLDSLDIENLTKTFENLIYDIKDNFAFPKDREMIFHVFHSLREEFETPTDILVFILCSYFRIKKEIVIKSIFKGRLADKTANLYSAQRFDLREASVGAIVGDMFERDEPSLDHFQRVRLQALTESKVDFENRTESGQTLEQVILHIFVILFQGNWVNQIHSDFFCHTSWQGRNSF